MVAVYKPGSTLNASWTGNYYDYLIPFEYVQGTEIDTGVSGSSRPTTTFYDGLGRKIQTKADSGNGTQTIVTDQNYDSLGRVTQASQPRYIAETSSTYWNFTPRSTAPTIQWTTTSYDPMGRLKIITAPDSTTTRNYYGLGGNNTSTVQTYDANNHLVEKASDVLGRLVSVKEYSGNGGSEGAYSAIATTNYSYTSLDQLSQVTDQPGNKTAMTYDSLGRKLYMQDPDMGSWSYNYDANGNLVKQTDAKAQSVNFTYDALNRLTGKSIQVAPTQTFVDTFDTANPTVWSSTNAIVPFSDGGNNVVKTTGTGANYNTTLYQNSFNLTSSESVQLRFKVDNANSVAHFVVESNDTNARRFGVIANQGRLYVQYSADGTNFLLPGDVLSSLLTNTYYVVKIQLNDNTGFSVEAYQESNPSVRGYYTTPSMPAGKSWRFHHWIYSGNAYIDDYKEFSAASPITVGSFGYDSATAVNGKGQRTSMSNSNSTVTWKYDARSRVSEAEYSGVTGLSGNRLFQWSYFGNDQVKTIVYPSLSAPGNASATDRETLTYSYNPQRLQNGLCTSLGGCYTGSGSYNALNQPLQVTFGNGVQQKWTYTSPMSRLQQLQVGFSSAPGILFDRSYTYDSVSNVKTITNNKNTQVQTFNYDYLDRLTSASAPAVSGDPGYSETYSYDTIGNLLTKAGVTYTNPTAGQAHPHAPNSVGSSTYTYDSNGNLVSGGGRSYTWDVENKPTGIISTGSMFTAESYTYDAEGERQSRTVGSTTTVYLAGMWEEVVGGVRRAQYQFGGATIAQRDSTGTVIYMHGDHLSSVSLVTSSSGAVVSQQEFDPWGKVRSGGVSETTNNYTGQKLDGTSLLYYHARYYDAVLGKFVSADSIVPSPSKPQQFNRYSYTGNNPLRFVDPSGHCQAPYDNNDQCWKDYDAILASNHVGFIDHLIDLSAGQMSQLLKWINRGVYFSSQDTYLQHPDGHPLAGQWYREGVGANWTGNQVGVVLQALEAVENSLKDRYGLSESGLLNALGLGHGGILTFNQYSIPGSLSGGWTDGNNSTINLRFDDRDEIAHQVMHEIGHYVDHSAGIAQGFGQYYYSERNLAFVGGTEDYAEAFANYVDPLVARYPLAKAALETSFDLFR